jgi:hypothetical protein
MASRPCPSLDASRRTLDGFALLGGRVGAGVGVGVNWLVTGGD